MSSGLWLYSSHSITDDELANIVLQSGGNVVADRSPLYFGYISSDQAGVGILRIPTYDGVFDHEGNPLDEEIITMLKQAKALLASEFKTWLYIRIGYALGSQLLAVRFAHSCCQHWQCIVANEKNELFTCKEINQLYQEGRGFTGYSL